MKISIVTTLYHSEQYIEEFHARASATARRITEDYQIVYVNDGSPDKSLQVGIKIASQDHRTILVDLSRNFGHHRAIMTGLAHANGDFIFLIDSDLEEHPEWLPRFCAKMKEGEIDVVFGVQEKRKGGFFERVTGDWFYRLFNLLSGFDMLANIVTARLMTRRYVDALLLFSEREIFLGGLCFITGFNQSSICVQKESSSETTYTLKRKMGIFINSVTSFSNTPLVFIFGCGIYIFIIAALYTFYLLFNRIFFNNTLSGWTSVMASVWLLGGLIISFLGVIGIYLSKIFIEVKQRPDSIIRSIYSAGKKE